MSSWGPAANIVFYSLRRSQALVTPIAIFRKQGSTAPYTQIWSQSYFSWLFQFSDMLWFFCLYQGAKCKEQLKLQFLIYKHPTYTLKNSSWSRGEWGIDFKALCKFLSITFQKLKYWSVLYLGPEHFLIRSIANLEYVCKSYDLKTSFEMWPYIGLLR